MSRLRSRSTVALALLALVVLAGCAGAGTNLGGGGGEPVSQDAPRASGGAPDAAGDDGPADAGFQLASGETNDDAESSVAVQQRARIWTGTVELTVEDFGTARDRIVSAARDRGGYLSDSSSRVHRDGNESWTSGRVVVRVPSEDFDATMGVVRDAGTVESSDTSVQDVTDQLVDLEARLESLRTERDSLRELMADANDTEAVLAVQQELSAVQTEIERLEAQRRSLQDRVAFSTITVELREPAPGETPGGDDQWWETGVVAAFVESVGGVAVALRALVVGLAYVAPYALVFGVPLVGGYAVWQRRGGSRSGETEVAEVASDDESVGDAPDDGSVDGDDVANSEDD